MDKLHIVKAGGNLLEDSSIRKEFLQHFVELEGSKILVHGGGKSATALAEKLGLSVQMVEGRRITDAAMLEVAVMTYAGALNKNLVAELQALGCNALGLSGADGNAVQAVKRPVKNIDYGYVGDVTQVNGSLFQNLCKNHTVPVCCALTHDGQGQLLNTNADTMAAVIAQRLSESFAVRLTYCFEKPGVLLDVDDIHSLIPQLTRSRFEELKASGQIVAGMLPKLTNCFTALEGGVAQVRIGEIALLRESIPHTQIVL